MRLPTIVGELHKSTSGRFSTPDAQSPAKQCDLRALKAHIVAFMLNLEISASIERLTFRLYRIFFELTQLFSGRSSAGLVVVSGPAHSGTTILAQTVGNLPDCELINYETGFFLGHGKGVKILPRLLRSRKKWVIEKTPLHIYRIEHVLSLLPDSRHLIVYRDPRDTVASVLMRLEGDFESAVKETLSSFQEILKVKNLRQVKIVRYEELVTNREETISDICIWLGLARDMSVLDVRNHDVLFGDGPGKLASGFGIENHVLRRRWQVRQPFFDGRGRHLSILTKRQLNALDREFHDVVRSLTSG